MSLIDHHLKFRSVLRVGISQVLKAEAGTNYIVKRSQKGETYERKRQTYRFME